MGDALQDKFDDLYSAVYAILEDAKSRHNVVKLYKGSHASPNPHRIVTDFGAFFHAHRRGLMAFASAEAGTLRDFDRIFEPRVSFARAFDALSASRHSEESPSQFLRYLLEREHRLGAYRGGSSGFDDESRALSATHFQQLGFSARPNDVLIFAGGFKGVFHSFCASLMCECFYDEVRPTGGIILAPEGYYQSLRLMPPVFGGRLDVVADITGPTVTDWLKRTSDIRGRMLYVPLVNNANGRVLSRDRAHGIARAVLAYNNATPSNPVHVFDDDVYTGSYLADDLMPTPIGTVSGTDVGNARLGRMSDWTVSVVTPSKTFAYPTSRIAIAHTTSRTLRKSLNHYRTVFSYGRVSQADELTAVMALCATPRNWITLWNHQYRNKLQYVQAGLNNINEALGYRAFHIDEPQGGWYMALHVSSKLFPPLISSSVDACSVFLNYGQSRVDTGIAMLPGELFGYRIRDSKRGSFILRGTLAVGYDDIQCFLVRLRHMVWCLRAWGSEIASHACKAARAVADVDAILRHTTY